jgi:hypothetical protein
MRVNASGNVLINTTTDAGFRLDVNGSVRATGSISAASAIARGTFLNQTLVATANNDVLVGLEINPTFTNGAFTGVKNNWINLVGNASINFTNQLYLKRGDVDVLFASSAETQLKTVSSSAPLKFFVGSTSQYAQFFATTGNLLLQNGGTFTDAGFKLDVNGTAIFRGNVFGVGSGGAAVQLLSTVGTNIGVIGGNASNPLRFLGQYLQFYVGGTQHGLFQPTTGNFVIQNGGVFTDETSARLSVNSTTQGFLPPRMTTTQKNAIASPAVGLVVYDTTLNKLCVRGASAWETITSV